MKGGSETGSGALGAAHGAAAVGRGERYLRQKKAEKLLEQRREGDGHDDGDGRRTQNGRQSGVSVCVWCLVWVRRRWQRCTRPPKSEFKRALDGHYGRRRGERQTGQAASRRKNMERERVRRRRQRVRRVE